MFGGIINPIQAMRAWRRLSTSPEYAIDERVTPGYRGTLSTEMSVNMPVLEVTPIDTRQIDVSPEGMLTHNRGFIKSQFMRHSGFDLEIQKIETLVGILAVLSWMHFNSKSDRFGLLMAIIFTFGLFQIKRI